MFQLILTQFIIPDNNKHQIIFIFFIIRIGQMKEGAGEKQSKQNSKPDANNNDNGYNNSNIVGYLTAGSLFKKDRKFTLNKNQKKLNVPQELKMSHRNTFNSEKVEAKYSQKPYLTERVRKNNNYFDDSFKITQFTNTQNTIFHATNYTANYENDDSLSKYQHRIVHQNIKQPNFDRAKHQVLGKEEIPLIKIYKRSPQKTENISDLQTSRRKYFSSCRQQAEKYLINLQAQLKQSQTNIKNVQNHVRNQIKQFINEKSLQLKELLIKMVDQFIEEWRLSQIQFYKINQMKYLGDTKQLLAQIEQRQKLLELFNVKLQFQQQQNWKKVTAQLLYFDYDTSIKQIHKMSKNMMNTVHQKYTSAMDIKRKNQLQKGQAFKFSDVENAKKQLINIFVTKYSTLPSPFLLKQNQHKISQQQKDLLISFGRKGQQKQIY